MTKPATVNLDSYRLAQYSVQVPCMICDEGNTFDAELCRHCHAPMALAAQTTNDKVRPQLIATIGSSGVGKTVYLGMLMDMLSRNPDGLRVLARGAFSVNMQQTTTAALSTCYFPDKTPSEPDRWNWAHCQIQGSKRTAELIMPDMAGEALLEEVDHPNTFKVVRSFLLKCSGAMIMIDAVKLASGTLDQDYFTMKLLSYLVELIDDPRKGWRNRPVAIVFSKADQCDDCFDDPSGYARKHAPGLWQHCQQRFRTYRFFAASVVGTCGFYSTREGRLPVPLRVEPRGIVEPFEWMFNAVKLRR